MTTASPTITDRLRDFVAAVGEHFADLPDADRDELLGDLEQHFKELAAEAPDVLEAELADPAAYAAELRAGAGIDESGVRKKPGRIARLTTTARDKVRAVVDHPRAAPLHEFLPMLRPAWWIARAWAPLVVVGFVLEGGTDGWSRHILVSGRNLLGLLALMAAAAFSVRAGTAGADEGRAWRIVNRVAAVAFVIVAWVALTAQPGQTIYVETYGFQEQPNGLLTHPDGEGITNLYVYDADGTLLEDVFIYDGGGRPVQIGEATDDWFGIRSEPQIDNSGRIIGNHYPIVQYVYDGEGALILQQPPHVDIPQLPNGQQSPSTTVPTEPPAPQPTPTTVAPEPLESPPDTTVPISPAE